MSLAGEVQLFIIGGVFNREYFERAINKTTYKRFSLNNNEFSGANALLISVNVSIIGEDSQLTTDRVCSCHLIKNDIRCRHQKMAFSLNEVLKLIYRYILTDSLNEIKLNTEI